MTLALHVDGTAVVKLVVHSAKHAIALLADLNAALHAGGVHSAADVHRVAPDVVEQLGGADHSGGEGSVVEPDPQLEFKAQHVFVEVVDQAHHFQGELEQGSQVGVRVGLVAALLRVEARRRHVGGADGLDFLDVGEVGLAQELVEVPDEFVQDAVALFAALVALLVELAEVDDAGEDDAHVVVVLGVALCHLQLLGHVDGDDVPQEPVRLVTHVLDLDAVLVGLHVAVVV